MIDQVSIIVSQRLRKGTGKGKVVNLFLIAISFFFFFFYPKDREKVGMCMEERAFWAKLHMFLLVSDSFPVSLFRVKKK